MTIGTPKDLIEHPAFSFALRHALGSKEAERFITDDNPNKAMENVLAMVAGFGAAAGSLGGLRVHLTSNDAKHKVDYEALLSLVGIMFEYGFNAGAKQAGETFDRPDGFIVPEIKNSERTAGFEKALAEYKEGLH